MATKIVSQSGKQGLVAGLTWVPLVSGQKNQAGEVRRILKESEATKIAIVSGKADHDQADPKKSKDVLVGATIGLFVPEDDDADPTVKSASKLHSLALAFANFVGRNNAIIGYQIKDSPFCAIIVIEDGVPILDDVRMSESAQELASQYSSGAVGLVYHLYTNNLGVFPNGDAVNDETLWGKVSKETLIISKPLDMRALFGGLMALIILGGSFYAYTHYEKEAARKKMIAEAKANNPVAKYEAELIPKLGSLGLNATSILSVLTALEGHVVRDSGWMLKSINCTTQSRQCTSYWQRDGGVSDELVASRSAQGDELFGEIAQNTASFKLPIKFEASGINTKEELPLAQADIKYSIPIYQVMANAGLDIKVGSEGYKTWPVVQGLVVPEAAAVKARPTEFSTSMPLMFQALKGLPPNFWWTDLQIFVSENGKNALDSMSISVKGKSYVR
jgi:hypothetical protein